MKTRTILPIFFLLFTVYNQAFAQQQFKTKDYVLNRIGDEWQYKNLAPDGLSPIITKIEAGDAARNSSFVKRTENNGDYRLQKLDKTGLWIYELYFKGNRFIKYEKPVLLMPAKFVLSKTYRSAIAYQTLLNNQLQDRGQQIYEVTAEKLEAVKVPLGYYKDCLVIRTVALRTDATGSQKGYEIREWHARGVGAVKITGELFWKNAKGEIIRTFKIDAELEKATINNKLVTAR